MVDNISYFLQATIRMATPLLLAGLGLIVAERAGLLNIGADGIMLMGAFAGYAFCFYTGSYWVGLLGAMAIGTLTSLLFAIATIHFKAPQVVIGAALNILCSGITTVMYRLLFISGSTVGTSVNSFPNINIPLLSKIPILGPMLFQHNALVYIAFIMTFATWFMFNKTSLGLKIIAVGEHPKAADSLGVNVVVIRYAATLFSGLMMGAAGAYLSIAQSNTFGVDMTGGKGFIALAVIILGKWEPVGVLLGAMVFGGANALQMSLQTSGISISNNLIMMVPYIVTVIAVLLVSKKKVLENSAKGVPYEKA